MCADSYAGRVLRCARLPTLDATCVQASRFVFSEINKRFPTMPFTMRLIEDSGRARLGLVECLNHELLHPYPVLHEKAGDVVAHLKCTVLITANGVDRVRERCCRHILPLAHSTGPATEIVEMGFRHLARRQGCSPVLCGWRITRAASRCPRRIGTRITASCLPSICC